MLAPVLLFAVTTLCSTYPYPAYLVQRLCIVQLVPLVVWVCPREMLVPA